MPEERWRCEPEHIPSGAFLALYSSLFAAPLKGWFTQRAT